MPVFKTPLNYPMFQTVQDTHHCVHPKWQDNLLIDDYNLVEVEEIISTQIKKK